MSVELYVDLDALQGLATRLQQIHTAMTSADGQIAGFGEATGSPRVAAALADFVEGWTDGRKRIDENLGHLMEKVRGAAETYLEQEEALAASYRVGAP